MPVEPSTRRIMLKSSDPGYSPSVKQIAGMIPKLSYRDMQAFAEKLADTLGENAPPLDLLIEGLLLSSDDICGATKVNT